VSRTISITALKPTNEDTQTKTSGTSVTYIAWSHQQEEWPVTNLEFIVTGELVTVETRGELESELSFVVYNMNNGKVASIEMTVVSPRYRLFVLGLFASHVPIMARCYWCILLNHPISILNLKEYINSSEHLLNS